MYIWDLYTESGEWICQIIHEGGRLRVEALGNEEKEHFFSSLRGILEHPQLGYIEVDARDAEGYGRMLTTMMPTLGVQVVGGRKSASNNDQEDRELG